MKTILLWDARFPERRPARLSVEDAVASAAVRAGVAAPAHFADAGALSTGGALDSTMLTEVVLQHGSGGATRRVFLPYSVVLVGAVAGVLVSIGTPIPDGVIPTPSPTIALSTITPSISANAAAGTLVSSVSNVPAGVTPAVVPNDGRLVIAGGASAGWKVVRGDTAISPGMINFSVAATGATGATGVLTVTAVAGVVAYTLHPRTEAYRSFSVASGSTPTAGELNALNRFHAIADEFGVTPALMPAVYQDDLSEGRFRINLMQPGTYDLAPVGAPTYTPGTGASGFAVNVGYRSVGLTGALLDPTKGGIFFNSGSAITSASPDAGYTDGTSGLVVFGRLTSGTTAAARLFSTQVTAPNGSYFGGSGYVGAHRVNGGVQFLRHGVAEFFTPNTSTTPAAPTVTSEVGWGWPTGAGSVSGRVMRGGFVSNGLTNAQIRRITAALYDLELSRKYGCPMIYPKGVGPNNEMYDVLVESCNAAGIFAAYEAKQENPALRVAIIGAHLESTKWHLGGHWSNGLALLDIQNVEAIAGKPRDLITFANVTVLGRADDTTQSGLSPDSRSINAGFRRMLDPSRTSGAQGATILPGLDIPVIMTGGIVSVIKTGSALTSVTTADGRTLNAKVFVAQGYDGDLVRLSGAPIQYGRGSLADGGGFRTGLLKPQTAASGTQLDVDVFRTPGDPASGYINAVIALPPLNVGDEDAEGLQPLNIRQTHTNTVTRAAPFGVASLVPDGYDAADYEHIARALAAATAAGVSIPYASLFKVDAVGSVFDINNGDARIGTDMPNSGILYHRAGANLANRSALMVRIARYVANLNWWLRFSGDTRIPAALITEAVAYFLDPLSHTDPGDSGMPLNYGVPYKREPLTLLKNAGYKFVIADMDGTTYADGSLPRGMSNFDTGTIVSYAVDIHSIRTTVDANGKLVVAGAVYNAAPSVSGGTNRLTPFAVRGFMTDAGVVSNMCTSVAVSCGRDGYGSYRMEQAIGQGAQTCGKYAALAANGDGVVHNVSYDTARAKLLADVDNSKLVLRQFN